jgi:hypothetical protein
MLKVPNEEPLAVAFQPLAVLQLLPMCFTVYVRVDELRSSAKPLPKFSDKALVILDVYM